jgi:hypothetical protein
MRSWADRGVGVTRSGSGIMPRTARTLRIADEGVGTTVGPMPSPALDPVADEKMETGRAS